MEKGSHSGTGSSSSLEVTAPAEVQIGRALLSVSDKTGIVEFARGLAELGVEIISTGGTAGALEEAGIPVRSITDLTGFPEIMDGRVKTLHPKLYAGLLAVRDNPEHVEAAREHDVEFVDLVCVNLYPFERTAASRGVADAEVIENIDIGGPTMIRAAAKNYAFAAPVISPESYDAVLDELRESDRRLSLTTRESLAAEAFAYTARYDTAIARWFQEKREDFPPLMVRAFEKVLELPYGENPHQRAAYYSQVGTRTHVLSMVSQLAGKELSFNNLLDLDAARLLLSEFQIPACVIIKHNNPCGVAVAPTPIEAYRRAFACDPMSAFGGVVVPQRPGRRGARRGARRSVRRGAVRPGLRRRRARGARHQAEHAHPRRPRAANGEPDRAPPAPGRRRHARPGPRRLDSRSATDCEVVSERRPTEAEWSELLFAWKVCKHVRSNAIVLAQGPRHHRHRGRPDEPRRLGPARAREGPDRCRPARCSPPTPTSRSPTVPSSRIDAGVTAIIQPGGSVRDLEVIEAIDARAARWCSPAADTSATDDRRAGPRPRLDHPAERRPALALRGAVRL